VAACAGWDVHNASGCTAAGNYSWVQVNTVTACCAACANESGSKCVAWSFHASSPRVQPGGSGEACDESRDGWHDVRLPPQGL
jgi:hypothetical protein